MNKQPRSPFYDRFVVTANTMVTFCCKSVGPFEKVIASNVASLVKFSLNLFHARHARSRFTGAPSAAGLTVKIQSVFESRRRRLETEAEKQSPDHDGERCRTPHRIHIACEYIPHTSRGSLKTDSSSHNHISSTQTDCVIRVSYSSSDHGKDTHLLESMGQCFSRWLNVMSSNSHTLWG